MADVDTIVFKIDVENKGEKVVGAFIEKLEKLKETAEKLMPTIQSLNETIAKFDALKTVIASISDFGAVLKDVAVNVKEFSDKVNIKMTLGDEIRITGRAVKEGMQDIQQEAEKTARSLGEFFKQDVFSGLKSGLNSITEYFPTFSSAAVGAVGLVKDAFSGLLSFVVDLASTIIESFQRVGAYLLEFAADAIKAFSSFEDQMSEVRKTMDLTAEETKIFGNEIREMALTMEGVDASTLADVATVAGQLGIAKENVLDFSMIMQKFEVATSVAAEKAATAFAKIFQAYNTPIEGNTVQKLADVVAFLGDKTAATEGQIINFLNRVAGTGAQLGIVPEKLAAIAATMESLGAGGERGATSFITTMSTMQTRVSDWAGALGIDMQTLKSAIETNAVGALTMVMQKFNELTAAEGPIKARELLKEMGLTSTYAAENFIKLSNNIPMLQENLAKLGEAQGSLDKQFQANLERFSVQWADFREIILEIYRIVGEPLVNALTNLLQTDINPLIIQFAQWLKTSELISTIWPGIINIMREAVLAVIEIGKVVANELNLESYINDFGAAWKEIEQSIITGIQAWTIEAIQFVQALDWNNLRQQAQEVLSQVGAILQNIWQYLTDISARQADIAAGWQAIKDAIDIAIIAWETIRDTAQDLWNIIKPLFEYLIGGAASAAQTFEGLLQVLKAFVQALYEPRAALDSLFEGIKNVFGGFVGWVDTAISSITKLGGAIYGIVKELAGVDKAAFKQSTFPDMIDWAGKTTAAVNTIGMSIGGLGTSLDDVSRKVADIAMPTTTVTTEKIKAPIDQFEYFKQQLDRYVYERGYDWTNDKGFGTNPSIPAQSQPIIVGRPATTASQPSQPSQIPPQQLGLPTTPQSAGLTINFSGTNIVDDNSLNMFVRKVTEVQKEQGLTVFTAA